MLARGGSFVQKGGKIATMIVKLTSALDVVGFNFWD